MLFYHTEILLIFILSGLLFAQREDSTLVISDQVIEGLVSEPVTNYEEFNVIDYLEELQKNPININSADLTILQKIPELDINYAQLIIQHREKYGHFFSTNELFTIKGLPIYVINNIKPFITVSDPIKQFIDTRLANNSIFNFAKILNIVRLSAPLGMAVIFNFLYDKIDIILISKLTDFSQVSFYSVGYGIYKSSSFAFSFLLISGFTRVSYLSRKKYAVKLFFIKYFKLILTISIFINVFLFFASDIIINIIYSVKYFNSILILKILSFAIIGLALNNLTGIILNALGLFKQNMFVTLSGLVINIILNIILIPYYGIIAAALTSILTEYIILTGDCFYLNKFLKEK